MDRSMEGLAYHEAGHAVHSVMAGYQLEEVVLGDDRGHATAVTHGPDERLFTKLAGPIAEGIFYGDIRADGRDIWMCMFYEAGLTETLESYTEYKSLVASALGWPKPDEDELLDEALALVFERVQRWWPAIERVAGELVSKRRMTHEQVAAKIAATR